VVSADWVSFASARTVVQMYEYGQSMRLWLARQVVGDSLNDWDEAAQDRVGYSSMYMAGVCDDVMCTYHTLALDLSSSMLPRLL
jgi:hypothetical protein